MRANANIVQGDFFGGVIEPGTFHAKRPFSPFIDKWTEEDGAGPVENHNPPSSENQTISDGSALVHATALPDTPGGPEVIDAQA